MTTYEQNMLLCRTGPGTPMGNLFRRYWIPAMHDWELPEPDCAPVRVQLLSERLIAFRNSSGRIGIMDEFCAHRRASLWFGRNEENGLRCPYHGWKFDVTGQCVDVPSEGADSAFCRRIKLTSYPAAERGGVIWVYMGPPEHRPELPHFEWMDLPASRRYFSKRHQESNYLQSLEGGIDSAHVSFLHSGEMHTDPFHKATKGAHYQSDVRPKFELIESQGGFLIGVRRAADEGNVYWRISQWIAPWYTMIPPYGDNALNGHAWVPIDDENCIVWSFTYHPTRDFKENEIELFNKSKGMHVETIPGTFRPILNKDNDYMMDREAQKAGIYYSGVKGVAMQDASIQESMGAIVDRTQENLASSDRAIVMVRRRLGELAGALETG
ncbi:MAG: Rieske 2Fe-2S domain-containing protein, partial [Alphaproteobacteria bacterium]